jgi:hypothetical protein
VVGQNKLPKLAKPACHTHLTRPFNSRAFNSR